MEYMSAVSDSSWCRLDSYGRTEVRLTLGAIIGREDSMECPIAPRDIRVVL